MSAAKAWGLTPSQWRCQEPDERARMLAHEIIAGIREGYLQEQLENDRDKSGGAPAKPSDPLFEAMKARARADNSFQRPR